VGGVLHDLVLLALLGLWTWKLLEPYPVPEGVAEALGVDWQFIIAKCLHFGGYAFLTFLAVTLPVPSRWRWAFVVLMALHGVGTEIGQTFVPNRTGTRRDVLIDWGGIALGVAAWRLREWGGRRV
jgi:VanZ family protein